MRNVCGRAIAGFAAHARDAAWRPIPATGAGRTAPIDGYLSELAGALVGPAPARAKVVREIADGLLEAADSYSALGLSVDQAVHAAIAEFGEPHLVGAAFRPELGARQARRTALTLIVSGPLVGIAWCVGAAVSSLPPARHQMPGPWWALPLVGLAIVVAVPSLVVTVIATGRRGLRLAFQPSLPPKAVSIASLAAVVADGTMLAVFSLYVLLASAPPPLLPLVPAIAASLVRMFLAARAFRGCLRTTAALSPNPLTSLAASHLRARRQGV